MKPTPPVISNFISLIDSFFFPTFLEGQKGSQKPLKRSKLPPAKKPPLAR